LLLLTSVDRGVIATASELFKGRHYPSVVAICADALESEPECVPLLLMRARAHVAMRLDLEAQADLRDVIRLDPQCSVAHRLLGELAARQDEHAHAIQFFREALRLDPGDREAAERLFVSEASLRPATVAQKLPAPATAAGRFPSAQATSQLRESQPRFARGTQQPGASGGAPDPYGMERPTKPFAGGSQPPPMRLSQREPTREATENVPEEVIPLVNPKYGEQATIRGRAMSNTPPAKQAPRLSSRSMGRSSIPELPGFGEYLVSQGILTRERLRAAQAYQRSMKVQLSTAIVTLGLATPQRIEWASVAHQSQLARGQ
jgi:tetratricopeptide (TPR) repeat protein